MYRTHFLKNDNSTLTKDAQEVISGAVSEVYEKVHTDLKLPECEILITINPDKVSKNETFFGCSYDETAIYLFANANTIHKKLLNDKKEVIEGVMEHCCRSLYTTARTQHIGLDADCGLLEEVINEGLAEVFVTEKMATKPKNRFIQLSEKEIKRLWEKIKNEHNTAKEINIEKWFWGNHEENIPPFAACAVGYAIATAHLTPFKKKSYEVVTTPAKYIAEKQSDY